MDMASDNQNSSTFKPSVPFRVNVAGIEDGDSSEVEEMFQREARLRREEEFGGNETEESGNDTLVDEEEIASGGREYFNSTVSRPQTLSITTTASTGIPTSTTSLTTSSSGQSSWGGYDLFGFGPGMVVTTTAAPTSVTSTPMGSQSQGNAPNSFSNAQLTQLGDVVKQVSINVVQGIFDQYHSAVTKPMQQQQCKMENDIANMNQYMIHVLAKLDRNAAQAGPFQSNPTAGSSRGTSGQTSYRGRSHSAHASHSTGHIPDPQQQQAEMLDAIRSIRFGNSRNAPIPKFNLKKTTAAEYIQEVEQYYEVTNVHSSRYLYLISTILPEQLKLWWDHYKSTVQTWQDFKTLFISKYDTCAGANERMRILQTRQQRNNEPTDAFVYEMIKMSKVVYPTEPLQQALERTRNALFHRLRVGLGAQVITSPEALIEAVSMVHAGLRAQDHAMNVKSDLPPLTATDKTNERQKNEKQHPSGSRDDSNQRDARGRGFTFRTRGRSYYRGRSGRSNWNSRHRSENSNQREGQAQRSSEESVSRRGGHSQSSERSHSQPNDRSRSKDKFANVQCLKCRGFGHRTDKCPNKRGIAMVGVKDSEDPSEPYDDEDAQNRTQDSDDLNQ